MCKSLELHYTCAHADLFVLSTCRGTCTRSSQKKDKKVVACISGKTEIKLHLSCRCPICARIKERRRLRDEVEEIRTINYLSKTEESRRAVREAEVYYDRARAVLDKMQMKMPPRFGQQAERSRMPTPHTKVNGGSPLKKELKQDDLEDSDRVKLVETLAEPKINLRKSSPCMPPTDPSDKIDDIAIPESSVALIDPPLCSCRAGFLCEYC